MNLIIQDSQLYEHWTGDTSAQEKSEDLNEEESDDDAASHMGMQSIMKSFAVGGNRSSAEAASSKRPRKAQPAGPSGQASLPVAPKRSAPPGGAAEPLAKQAKPTKIDIGTVGGRKGKGKAKAKANPGGRILSLDMQERGSVHDLSDLCDADQQLLNEYESQFKTFQNNFSPPLPDAPFKSYFADLNSKISSTVSELRKKQRSAGRRTLGNQDPLYLAMDKVIDQMIELQHLAKCILANTYDKSTDNC